MQNLRIVVIGNSGTGKSTLADKLGKKFNVPVYHLDRELLYGQFYAYNPQEQRQRHSGLIRSNSWVIDGNYRGLLSDRLARATHVVFLDVSRPVALKRVLVRYLKNIHLKTSIPEGAQNGMSLKFMKWVLSYSRKERLAEIKKMLRDYPDVKLVTLRSDSLKRWLDELSVQLIQD